MTNRKERNNFQWGQAPRAQVPVPIVMEKKLQNPAVVCILALFCCTLWGSAFPCIKIGYKWLEIEGTGSQILFAGYRFFMSGIFTFVIGCILGLAGVIIINLEPGAWGDGFHIMGEGMILICTIAYGVSTVFLKMISDRESPMTITAYQTLFGSILLIVIGLLLDGQVEGFTWKSSLLLVYMAMLSTVAFSLWTMLLKYNTVGKVAVYGFSIPIFGVLFSAMFLGEQAFSLKNLAALILVSGGILIVNKRDAALEMQKNG